MKPRSWGIVLIIIAVLLNVFSGFVKIILDMRCNCSSSYMVYTLIWLLGGIIAVFGFLLLRSGEVQNHVKESHLKLNKELLEAKLKERKKSAFIEFVKDFNKDETEVIEVVHTYEGITRTELEGKVNLSKAVLDRILKKLEKDGIVSDMDSKVYLRRMSK